MWLRPRPINVMNPILLLPYRIPPWSATTTEGSRSRLAVLLLPTLICRIMYLTGLSNCLKTHKNTATSTPQVHFETCLITHVMSTCLHVTRPWLCLMSCHESFVVCLLSYQSFSIPCSTLCTIFVDVSCTTSHVPCLVDYVSLCVSSSFGLC